MTGMCHCLPGIVRSSLRIPPEVTSMFGHPIDARIPARSRAFGSNCPEKACLGKREPAL